MTVKKSYEVGDTVWIYGIDQKNNKSKKGKVVHSFTMNGYIDTYYVIAIPTEIEDLLEIRTWHTISQDDHGPVGSFRDLVIDQDTTRRLLSKAGMTMDDDRTSDLDEDDISPDRIHEALERAKSNVTHAPLVLKDAKPKRRFYKKKPKS